VCLFSPQQDCAPQRHRIFVNVVEGGRPPWLCELARGASRHPPPVSIIENRPVRASTTIIDVNSDIYY
jgi:hypothetical protein